MKIRIDIHVVLSGFTASIVETSELCCPDAHTIYNLDLDELVETINKIYNVKYTAADYCCHENTPHVSYKLEFEK